MYLDKMSQHRDDMTKCLPVMSSYYLVNDTIAAKLNLRIDTQFNITNLIYEAPRITHFALAIQREISIKLRRLIGDVNPITRSLLRSGTVRHSVSMAASTCIITANAELEIPSLVTGLRLKVIFIQRQMYRFLL